MEEYKSIEDFIWESVQKRLRFQGSESVNQLIEWVHENIETPNDLTAGYGTIRRVIEEKRESNALKEVPIGKQKIELKLADFDSQIHIFQ